MSAADNSLLAARIAEREARARLSNTVSEIKLRLQPATLVREARDRVRGEANDLGEKAAAAVRERPALAGLTGGAVVLLLLRKPIGRLIGRVFSKRRETAGPETG